MKKINLPEGIEKLGMALSVEEMKNIPIGSTTEEYNCTCILYLAGKPKQKSHSTEDTEGICSSRCKSRCDTYNDCYHHVYIWKVSEGSGSDSGSGSDFQLNEDS